MKDQREFINLFNRSIWNLFENALKTAYANPAQSYFFLKTLRAQKKASQKRTLWEKKGVHVPPFMIASITNRCNLHCSGCYANARDKTSDSEMSKVELTGLISEANELGISIVILGGGEPFPRREIMEITSGFPDIIFPLFTNGLLMDDGLIAGLKKQKNVVPVISMEGHENQTDERRGKGVHDAVQKVILKMKKAGIFYGVSLTVTTNNFDTITNPQYIKEQVELGCKLFFYIEYIPIKKGTEKMVINQKQREELQSRVDSFRAGYPGLFITFPGDEEEFGGCLSAGRGFVHVSPEGDLEPCPFAPYSDSNLKELSLKDALKSDFLKRIRESNKLGETRGGCALFAEREWVRSLIH
jgi:MoaA/NifB/PqqE/SkfB family radical SAM enzyme